MASSGFFVAQLDAQALYPLCGQSLQASGAHAADASALCHRLITARVSVPGIQLRHTATTAAASLLLWSLIGNSVSAVEPQTRGRILFLRCASCHDISDSASQKIGPNLRGIVGRQVASLSGFQYSAALQAQHFVWDSARLDQWLSGPSAMVPGTIMAFAGIDTAADRQAIIEYLKTQP
jgi:cytochrome c